MSPCITYNINEDFPFPNIVSTSVTKFQNIWNLFVFSVGKHSEKGGNPILWNLCLLNTSREDVFIFPILWFERDESSDSASANVCARHARGVIN